MTLPIEQGDTLDYIILGETRSPGTCIISGHDRYKDWDVQKAKGQTGATSKLNGDPIGTFQIVFKLAGDGSQPGPDQFEQWNAFQKLIESLTDGPTPKALSIYHPDLAANHFTEVSSGGVSGGVHDGLGGKSYTVKFIEYKPPKKKPTAKAVAKTLQNTDEGKRSPPDPNAQAKAELAELLSLAKKA